MHDRHSIRLPGYDYSSNGLYFVTLCSYRRQCIFGDVINGKMELNKTGELINFWWKYIPNRFPNVKLDIYQVMPNHFHGIIIINSVGAGIFPPQNGILPPQNGILPPQNGILPPQNGVIPPQNGILPPQNGIFPPQNGITSNPMGREDRAPTLGQIIAYFKYQSTKTNNPPGSIIQIWQRNFYEHIIRSEPELVNIRKYISNNPISWNHDPNNPLQPL